MRVSRVRLILLFIGLSGLILLLLQSTSGARKASASQRESLLDRLRPDRVPPTLEVPVGTRLHVRLKERITDQNQAGDIFVGRLDRDVARGGNLLIPHGSRVIGRIVSLGEITERSGATEVSLILEQMLVGKKAHPLESMALALSMPAKGTSSGGNSLSLRGPSRLGAEEWIEEPDGINHEATIYEPETRLTFVLAERLWLPVFAPAD
ncbi:MAG: hypothetical protein EHM23_20980 [Acidobacteria bacterium]|nr:MAG: hypothetical protein EHM23_20980 [Acidobacteriota bacterium]